mgnify:FL=1
MKRINIIVTFVLMMFLVQCKPDDELIDGEEGRMVKLYGDVEMPYSRMLFDSTGYLEWSPKDDYLYLFNTKYNKPHIMKNSASSQYPGHLNFACYYNQSPLSDYLKRNIYYVGNTAQRKDSTIYQDLRGQTGKMSDVGKNIMGKMTVMAELIFSSYHYDRTTLGVITSVIRIDLPEMECEKYYLDYEGCCNYFEARFTKKVAAVHPNDSTQTVDDMQNKETYYPGRVDVSGSTKDTYIVVYPQSEPIPNTIVSIYADDEKIGSVVFPNGIRSNKLYVAEGGGSIQINGRSKVVEDDLFTTRE